MERIKKQILNVDNTWTNATVERRPGKYIILRARAIILSGAATQIALRVSEAPSPTDDEIALEYTLTDDLIDYEEYVFFESQKRDLETGAGTTYLSCKCDAGDNTIMVILDIEPIR